MSFLLVAIGCSRSVQWEGIDKNATWDFHAKDQSTPLESSSLIRPDKALEEQKSNAGSKSAWKEAKTGLVHITGKSWTPRNPGFLCRSGSWAGVWALCWQPVVEAAWTTRWIPSFLHDVWEFLVGLMAWWSAREGLSSAHIPLTPHYHPRLPLVV